MPTETRSEPGAGRAEGLTEGRIEELVSRVRMIAGVAMGVSVEDAAALVEQCEHERTIMPFLDPAQWLRTGDRTEWHPRFLRAFLTFRRELESLVREEEERTGRPARREGPGDE